MASRMQAMICRLLALQYLGSRTEAGTHGSMNGAPVAGSVGVLAREVKCIGDWFGHLGRSIDTSGGDIAIGTHSSGIALPVLRLAGEKEGAKMVRAEREDLTESTEGI